MGGISRARYVLFTSSPTRTFFTPGYQAHLDYVHAMTRLPELHASLADTVVPDAAEETEFESLVRAIPKLMGILPDVLYLQSDPRHKVALAEMMSGLTAVLDQVKPLALVRPFLFACSFFS